MLPTKCIKRNEDLVNDKDETDIEYITSEFNNIKGVLEGFCSTCNIEIPKETGIDNSTLIETPKWLTLKRSVLNPNYNDNKCFQYSIVLSLYREQIGKHSCRISQIRPFIDNPNWENTSFPLQEQDYQQFEMNNKSITLNVLQVNEQKISHLDKSELNRTRENRAILLVLTDDEKQHHVAVKNLNSLLKDKNKCSEHFYVNCFKKFRTKTRLEKHYQAEDC